MEQKEPFAYSEVSEPKRYIVRSDAAFYALLLLGAFGCIALSRFLAAQFGTLRIWFQAGLYALLILAGYWIYKTRMTSYRYTLDEEGLRIYRIVGRRETLLESVPYRSIVVIGPWAEQTGNSIGRTYNGKRENTLCVAFRTVDEMHTACLSASDRFRELLEERVYGQ